MDISSRNVESTAEESMLQSTAAQKSTVDPHDATDVDILKRRPIINEKMLLAYDIAIDETAYASVEHDFQDINADLRGDEALEQFREEYDKLFLSIRKSRENERAMISKVRELAQTYSYQQQKVKTAEKMILEDQQTIDQLTHDKSVMEEAQAGQTDNSMKHMSALERAQAEVDKLKIVIDQMNSGNYSQVDIPEQQQFEDLTRQMRQNQNEYNNNNDTINALNQQVKQLQLNTNQLQQDQNTNIITIKQLKDENFILKQEANEYKNKKNLIEQEMLQLRSDCQVIQQSIEENQAKLDEITKVEEDVHKQVTFQQNLLREIGNQKQAVNEQKQSYHKQLQQLNQALQSSLEQNKQLQVTIDKGKQHNMDLQSTILQMQNAGNELQANITKQQQRREQVEKEIAEYQQRFDALVAETYQLKLSNNELAKQISNYQQQHNIHTVQQSQVQKQMVQQATVQNSIDQQFSSDQRELMNMQQEVQRRRNEINNLQKEVNNYNQQTVHLTNQFQQAQLEYKKRCQQIEELQDVMTGLDAKLKSQQMLYETVRNDKNLCQKALIEYQDKISDLRRIFRVNTHVIEQLRAEIAAKDLQLMREHFQQKQYQQEKEAVSAKLEQIKIQKRENELRIQQQKEQLQQQRFVIQEAAAEHQRQQKEHRAVEQEAAAIQQLLIKRNHELEDVYEKDRVLQALLRKGELRYQAKLQQLKSLRQGVQDLRNQILSAKRQTSDLSHIKKEIHQLEKDLLDERAKTRALMQELQQPMNVHRWRQLEGSDPQTYQMIMKVQNLQKILNRKSAESKQKDVEIAEKERVYEELKKIVARLPTGDQVEKLQKYQQTLKSKKSELKQAREELQIYAIQAKSLQTQIEAYQNDLQQIRKEYFRAKDREVAKVTADWQGAPELNKYDDIDLDFDEGKYYDQLNQDELEIIKQAEEGANGASEGGVEAGQPGDASEAAGAGETGDSGAAQ